MTKLRWRIAYLLNRIPGYCWSDLVMWVLRQRGEPGSRWPAPDIRICLDDRDRTGTCYCGKLGRRGA